jgi:hypothetical protein
MNWLKRNVFLVAGIVGALLLLALAGFYLYRQKDQETTVTSQLNAQITEWKRLTTRNPSANETNIVAARRDQKKLADLLQATRKYFVPAGSFTNVDSASFKTLLETSIFELEQTADRQGVTLPQKYSFTATKLRESVVFEPAELVPLAYQLAEIKALCRVLFDARIHSLVRLRRVPVSKKDTGSSDFLTGKKAVTNAITGAVVIPYEVTFQGFSSELAAVLSGLQRSPHCFMVKMLDVQSAGAPAAGESMFTTPAMTYQPYGGGPQSGPTPLMTPQTGEDLMRDRYGLRPGGAGSPASRYGREGSDRYGMRGPGGRYGPTAGPTPSFGPTPAYGPTPGGRYAPPPSPGSMAGAPPGPRRGPETVLDEELLKVIMLVEAVRLPPAAD